MATQDGTRLAYCVSRGEGAGRIVLIHSLAMDGTFWDRVVPVLEPYADVLVYDCRGHGLSKKPPGPYSASLFGSDLGDLLDHVGWKSAVVAGASMGGCVALSFAAAYPHRVEALGLFDTTAWYGPDAPRQWAERAQKARDEGLAALAEFQRSRWFSDAFRQAHPNLVNKAVATFLANDLGAYAETCRMLGAFDARQSLTRIAVPTAIVVGSEDYATPLAMAREMESKILGAKLQVIEGTRHFTPIEAPDIIAARLIALLAESK